MTKADLALYKAKQTGRSRHCHFESELSDAARERCDIEAELRIAVERGEFELFYQPLINVVSFRPGTMEALVRWRHPQRGLITPDVFIPLAEETGLITTMGRWILRTGCAAATRWPADVRVAINVSPVQFRQSDLLEDVLRALAETGLPPERLEIEVTERVLLDPDSDHLATFAALKRLGVSIALDDFGTGYSSMHYLTQYPFDKIKIDRSFTAGILDRKDCAAIVCTVANLGRLLDIETVAEGVETREHFEALRGMGITQAQGYLFGRPAPAPQDWFGEDEFTERLGRAA